jgi:cytidylate kinase
MSTSHPDHPVTIAIDGPSGAGKSTIARMLADRLGVPYLDTGAMYRAIGLLAHREGIRVPLDDRDSERVGDLAMQHPVELAVTPHGTRVFVDGQDVSDEIRSADAAMMASAVSAVPAVRHALVLQQQAIAAENGGVVEGRDIGTVVLPDADLKVFLTASADERARRRTEDLRERGEDANVASVREQQARRDRQDTTRGASPLQVARGSVVLDTTDLGPSDVVDRLVEELESRRRLTLDTCGEDPVRSRNHGS